MNTTYTAKGQSARTRRCWRIALSIIIVCALWPIFLHLILPDFNDRYMLSMKVPLLLMCVAPWLLPYRWHVRLLGTMALVVVYILLWLVVLLVMLLTRDVCWQ